MKEKELEFNFKLKRLMNGWNVPDIQQDQLIFEILKLNRRYLYEVVVSEQKNILLEIKNQKVTVPSRNLDLYSFSTEHYKGYNAAVKRIYLRIKDLIRSKNYETESC